VRRCGVGPEADVDRRHLQREGRALQSLRDLELLAVPDDVIVGHDVAVGRDDKAAAATDLDVIDIGDLLAIDVLEFHVDAAGQPDEDGGIGGRLGALRASRARHQHQRRREHRHDRTRTQRPEDHGLVNSFGDRGRLA
jgi:hypothetical protein